ncbi:MAG: alpha/beta hydrolase, partial [Candidatus Eremiobacteraeota bacterium]|nr:alpha/beta hydrolase [Candidatus Eremiobacteraeota bacterium]
GYDDSGGGGVPVVLLHGFPLDRTVWDEQLAGLAVAGARVVRIDLRGCGESEPSDGPALMEALAGDVAGVLDALHVERAALVGHSIGGYVALAFFRMYEERVAGLALVASHVAEDASRKASADPAQRELAAGRDDLAARLERDGTMDAAVESYLPRYFAPGVYHERPELVERARAIMQRQNPRGCAQLVRGMKERLDSHDLLEDVRVPSLVIAGAQDSYLKPETLRATAAAIGGAQFVPLERVGHLPMTEAPEETANALATFAQRVRG